MNFKGQIGIKVAFGIQKFKNGTKWPKCIWSAPKCKCAKMRKNGLKLHLGFSAFGNFFPNTKCTKMHKNPLTWWSM